MQYRKDKYGNDISILGYGCMRFTQKAGRIDLEKAEREIKAAYEAGINYYDTAYIYPGNETALGEIISRLGIRKEINIATKLPHYLVKKPGNIDKMFREELKRLQTDYIDYYLMHMLNDVKTWDRLKTLGVDSWIRERREDGAIRQIGFSYHGNSENFCRLIDAYDWDFAMIQYNYMDENTQAGFRGLDYAASKGVPVIIMEPLRGGRLVNDLPREVQELFENHPKHWTPAKWAFRWLWSHPQVTCILSGMNSMEMLHENIECAAGAAVDEFTQDDNDFLKEVARGINAKLKVRCTGCGYCMPCPRNVDIPGCFSAYNRRFTDSYFTGVKEYMQCTTMRKELTVASNCIGCGMCEKHCPQNIPIRKELQNVMKTMEGPVCKMVGKVIRAVMKY